MLATSPPRACGVCWPRADGASFSRSRLAREGVGSRLELQATSQCERSVVGGAESMGKAPAHVCLGPGCAAAPPPGVLGPDCVGRRHGLQFKQARP